MNFPQFPPMYRPSGKWPSTNRSRRYPRTLNEAFGPYTSRDFTQPKRKGEVLLAVLCAVAVAALLWVAGSL